MTDIIPAPEGLWAIVALYPETETFAGSKAKFGAGEPELGATPVVGFARAEDDANTLYPLILNSCAGFVEPLTGEDPMYEFRAYVMTNGAPFIASGFGEAIFTTRTLPEEYRHLLADNDTAGKDTL